MSGTVNVVSTVVQVWFIAAYPIQFAEAAWFGATLLIFPANGRLYFFPLEGVNRLSFLLKAVATVAKQHKANASSEDIDFIMKFQDNNMVQ